MLIVISILLVSNLSHPEFRKKHYSCYSLTLVKTDGNK
ncbi:hypothetical protein Emtol_1018 [Emticicia oligotrophica DSM 17448]|uniref:Uncharacterized protein n=1 Tax=Emticicia oligotrophica (strain DSM 17448 / CIP 109782 / MTCC 6937 / GPTSA100-15) TaxID=929562 RepID=A0ABM5MYD7_EMTOG|nr:hypothetical protein Emtol_1018 [Emticicia oligotrophica DSM 17448]